jgi:predicted lipoprotein with Yx(FWY)xxD motif
MKLLRTVRLLPLLVGSFGIALSLSPGLRSAVPVSAAPRQAASSSARVLVVRNAKLGRILTNAQHRALYYFKLDRPGHSACTGQCATIWHPLLAGRSGRLSAGHLPGKLGIIMRSNGAHQITYNGWPLYTYAGDKRPGQTSGQGVAGTWFVATPSLKPYKAPVQSPPPSNPPPPAGNCIPQGGGGDGDGDNSGAPSDGDGCV